MSPEAIGGMLGRAMFSLLLTLLVSRLFLWLTRRWDGSYVRLTVVYFVCLWLFVFLAAANMARGLPFDAEGLLYNAVFLAFWFILSLVDEARSR